MQSDCYGSMSSANGGYRTANVNVLARKTQTSWYRQHRTRPCTKRKDAHRGAKSCSARARPKQPRSDPGNDYDGHKAHESSSGRQDQRLFFPLSKTRSIFLPHKIKCTIDYLIPTYKSVVKRSPSVCEQPEGIVS